MPASQPSVATPSEASPAPTALAQPRGTYISYAECLTDPHLIAGTTQVLFFHSSSCAECQELERRLVTEGLPVGLTVIKVDFDTYGDVRDRYGVRTEGTFVQIDGLGKKVRSWSGSGSGADILRRTEAGS